MSFFITIVLGALGAAISLVSLEFIVKFCARMRGPNRTHDLHHTHKAPVPRVGGIALAVPFVVIQFFVIFMVNEGHWHHESAIILLSSVAMFFLGLADDLKPLGAKKKLLGQILIAAAVYWLGIRVDQLSNPFTGMPLALGWGGFVLTVVWLVSMTNLINLIDGVDGLAGGICLMLMLLLTYVGQASGEVSLLAAGMAGALLGFLRYNFPPARIYMGDGGAYLLGFLIGLLTIVSSQKGTIIAALVAPLFVLALPIVDTALAILRRGMRGLPIFRPDRMHIHHRLLDMGISHRKLVLGTYAFTLVFLLMGFVAFSSRGQMIPLLSGLAALVLVISAGQLSFSREWFAIGRTLGNSLEMRHEIQYALALTRWLALEGGRCAGVEELWADLVFVVQKLGFSSVKLQLEDGSRVWQRPGAVKVLHSCRHELRGGLSSELELVVHSATEAISENVSAGEQRVYPALQDQKSFEIMSELVAEGWLKAATQWKRENRLPLLFGSVQTLSKKRLRPPNVSATEITQ